MKTAVVLTCALSLAAVMGVGCEKQSTVEKKETVTTAAGSTTTTDTHKVESSGSKPPLSASGEKAQ